MYLSAAGQDVVDFKELYQRVDAEMANWPQYVRSHRGQIDSLKLNYRNAHDIRERYRLCDAIFDGYREFQNDSALFYVEELYDYAREIGDLQLIGSAQIKKAYQAAKSGMYAASLDYLSEVDTLSMDENCLLDYYRTRYYLMGEMFSYCYIWEKRDEYVAEENRCRQEIMKRLPQDSGEYLMYRAYDALMRNQYEEAEMFSNRCLRTEPKNTPVYKLAAFHRRFICECLNQPNMACFWLAESAISEMRQAMTDQVGLWSLASKMGDDELERQYRYIRFSWDAAKMFGQSSVRSWQITPVLSTVEHQYQEEVDRLNSIQQLGILCLSVLIIVLLALLFINSQRKRIALARSQLEKRNTQLAAANTQLSILNVQLSDSSRAKEEYIVQLLEYNSEFIDQKEEDRRNESKLLRNGKMKELTRMLNSADKTGKELNQLLARFDDIFLGLYPTFIEEFNALLNEEGKIKVIRNERMNTPLRIFALLRLGIEKTADVSKILHCSANTVYNYRAQLKNAYLFERDEFEDAVRRIGMPGLVEK